MTLPADHPPCAAQIRAATLDDLDTLAELVRSYHEFEGIEMCDGSRMRAIEPLVSDDRLGGIWIIETSGRPCGYIALCYGYSIEFGGRDAFVDEFYVTHTHRGQGIGRLALRHAAAEAAGAGIVALHLEVARHNERARRLYRACGFEARENYHLMSRTLATESGR